LGLAIANVPVAPVALDTPRRTDDHRVSQRYAA
jgi:hypothetical protein